MSMALPLKQKNDAQLFWVFATRIGVLFGLFFLINELSKDNAAFLYIAAGHAHFLQAYIAQYRAGKFTRNGVLGWLILLPAAYSIAFTAPYVFTAVISVLFLLHNYVDDAHLLSVQNKNSAILMTAPVFIIYLGISFQENRLLPVADAALIAGTVLYGLALLYGLYKRSLYESYMIYVALQSALIMGACYFLEHWTALHLFSLIIMGHVMNWYIHITARRAQKSVKQMNLFLTETLMANLLFFSLPVLVWLVFAVYFQNNSVGHNLQVYFYSIQAFSVWALLHMATSLRGHKPGIFAR